MGAKAQGKINASEAQVGDRIIVKVYEASREEDQVSLNWVSEQKGETVTRAVGPSRTKTGAGVVVTRIIAKIYGTTENHGWTRRAQGRYTIITAEGEFEAAPIQTMWLAPEDAAGIKRAHAEALELDKVYEAYPLAEEAELVQEPIEIGPVVDEAAAELAEAEERTDEERAGIYNAATGTQDAQAEHRATTAQCPNRWHRSAPVRGLVLCPECPVTSPEALTLNSHAGKVDDMNNDASTETVTREATGSAVVRLLEKVHERIRQNHPEVPAVVIVTGAGMGQGGNKWGHFRPQGWMAGEDARIHEMFMAGETLAKGARQVLQTMLHESAHALAETRGKQDTSRQGRWHNRVFLQTAQEMGLEYRHDKASPQLGYSQVTLTDATVDEYADLLDDLSREIHLMVRLPGWLGGQDDNGESEGGEGMGKAPAGPAAPNTNNLKAVCKCEEPNIIRLSRKVLDRGVVRCEDCEELFSAA